MVLMTLRFKFTEFSTPHTFPESGDATDSENLIRIVLHQTPVLLFTVRQGYSGHLQITRLSPGNGNRGDKPTRQIRLKSIARGRIVRIIHKIYRQIVNATGTSKACLLNPLADQSVDLAPGIAL